MSISLRRNAQRVYTLKRQLTTEIMAWLGKNDLDVIKVKNPFVIQLDVCSPTGDDWGTESLVVTHVNQDGTVYGEGSEVDPVKISDLDSHEIAFLLDELELGNYITE